MKINREDNLRYYREYNQRNKEARRAYRQANKEHKKEYQAELQKRNLDEKRFYCEACDVACISNYALKKHFETEKHLLRGQGVEYDIFNNAPSLPTSKDLVQVAHNRGIPWKVIKGYNKIELAQLLNIPLIMNPNY